MNDACVMNVAAFWTEMHMKICMNCFAVNAETKIMEANHAREEIAG